MSGKKAKEARKAESLQGWKIDVRSYMVPNPMAEGGEAVELSVKDNLVSILFHSELKLGAEEMFKAKDLADKIRAAKNYLLVDKSEMDRLKRSYAIVKGLPERFIEFLGRIRDAEEVSLKEDEG